MLFLGTTLVSELGGLQTPDLPLQIFRIESQHIHSLAVRGPGTLYPPATAHAQYL